MRSSRFAVLAAIAAVSGIAGAVSAVAVNSEPTGSGQKPPTFGSKAQEILLTKITVSDLVNSYEFYTQVFGLKLVTTPDFPLAKAPTRNDSAQEFVEIPLNFSGSIADPISCALSSEARVHRRTSRA